MISDPDTFKLQAFEWGSNFDRCCYFDHNSFEGYAYNSFDLLLAAGSESELLVANELGAFHQLKEFCNEKKDWLFGYLSYDLKNDIESLSSDNFDGTGFPPLHFFQPKYVLTLKGNLATIQSKAESPFFIFQKILEVSITGKPVNATIHQKPIGARMPQKEYLEKVKQIRQHIIRGDIYEMNFCQEFFLEDFDLNEKETFLKLNRQSVAPFSCYYRLDNKYLLSSSPERFLKKQGNKLISQPIKGTIKRGASSTEERYLKEKLYNSKKDRSENVMIVDLVRNDLSKSCKAGSVSVEELYGIKTFSQVHHLVSTVSGEIKENVHFIDAIKNAFPMGSMTGAPKVRSMELIEQYEVSKRGLYSGAVGYITPTGDFDFNVVIRSIIYNKKERYLSSQVGGAIVFDSVPKSELEECLLKAKGMFAALGVTSTHSVQNS